MLNLVKSDFGKFGYAQHAFRVTQKHEFPSKFWIFEFSIFFPMLSYIWIVRSIFAPMLSYIWIVRSIFAPMLMSRGVAGGRRGSRGSRGVAGGRRRRRQRRRANNSPIWPQPWTITPRDQISRSGSIPHFDFQESRKIKNYFFQYFR